MKAEENWWAGCVDCGQIYSVPNGAFVEAWGKIHAEEEQHKVVVGLLYDGTTKCECGGFDKNFDVVNPRKVDECRCCRKLVCECGFDESGQEHWHTENEIWG